MKSLGKNLENRKLSYDKLLEYGFRLKNEKYIYEVNICSNKFKVVIEISEDVQIAKVIDLLTNEEYILVDVETASGDFVGKVKEEYNLVINDVIEKCTTKEVFKNEQTKKIIQYIKEKYQDDLEYLWEKFPNNAIWRNKKNNKWYGILLVINENKLDLKSNKMVEIIDLRYPKEKINTIVDNKKVFKGYHMNKNSWITLKLDNSMELKDIYELIDISYELSLKK